jgi:lipid-binding SYLF domain-containing protein
MVFAPEFGQVAEARSRFTRTRASFTPGLPACRESLGPPIVGRRQREARRRTTMSTRSLIAVIVSASVTVGGASVTTDEAAEITRNAKAALQSLYAQVPEAKALGARAHAILVFPKVVKAGLGIGGQSGEGALFKGGETVGYYRTSGASIGLQAGGQTYGYAMFLMNAKALEELNSAKGFEVGVGPSVVVMDEGKAKNMTTTTMKHDIYAFIFGQKGLMAGLGIQGNKISKINPK